MRHAHNAQDRETDSEYVYNDDDDGDDDDDDDDDNKRRRDMQTMRKI